MSLPVGTLLGLTHTHTQTHTLAEPLVMIETHIVLSLFFTHTLCADGNVQCAVVAAGMSS